MKFLRRIWSRYSKLGRKRKKKQVWRRPKGRDNKMREKRKGYPKTVSVGYIGDKEVKGTIEGKKSIMIRNVKDLEMINKNEIGIIGNIGKKKKIEIAKKAKEKGIPIHNLNIKTFLAEVEKRKAKKEKTKTEKEVKEKKKEIKEEKTEKKKDIIKDIEKSGVSEKVAEAEEAIDEKGQLKEKKK